MKRILIVFGIALLANVSCKDKDPEPKCESWIDINDLIGTWVSSNSIVQEADSGNYILQKCTLVFSHDSIVDRNTGKKHSPSMHRTGHGIGSHLVRFPCKDSIYLYYNGPLKAGYIDKNHHVKHRIIWLENKDSMIIDDFRKSYFPSVFKKFIKVQ